jgi:hypothetical protein
MTDRTAETVHIPEKDRVTFFPVGELTDGTRVGIGRTMDKDGKFVHYPIFDNSGEDVGGIEADLDSETKHKIGDCMKKKGLPFIAAVHLVMNESKLSIDQFPDSNELTMMIPLYSHSFAGKSTILAIYALEYGGNVLNFDWFSKTNVYAYIEAAKSKRGDVTGIVEAVSDFETRYSNDRLPQPPLRENLDRALEKILEVGPGLIWYCDFPGILFDGQSPSRSPDELDVIALQSFELPPLVVAEPDESIVESGRQSAETLDAGVEWLRSDGEYMNRWSEVRSSLMN